MGSRVHYGASPLVSPSRPRRNVKTAWRVSRALVCVSSPCPIALTRVSAPSSPPPHQTSLDVLEAEHNIAQVERMQLRERRVVIERDGKEAWKWLEWTAMKVQFAKEVLAHAEGEHLQRKVTFDALAADLERNNAVASETDDTIRKLEGKLSAAGATVPPVAPVPSVAAASSAGAPDTAAYPNAPYNEKKEEKTMPRPPVSHRPRPTSKVRGNDDTDHLRDGYAKAYIRKPFFPVPSSKKNNTPAGSSVPILFGSMGTRDSTTATTTTTTTTTSPYEPSAPPFNGGDPPLNFFDDVVGSGAMPRVDSGASDSGSFDGFDGFNGFGADGSVDDIPKASLESVLGKNLPPQSSPASMTLRAYAVSDEERARDAAVERSRAEATEARAAARTARERRESFAATNGSSSGSLHADVPMPERRASPGGIADRDSPTTAHQIPPAFASDAFADFGRFTVSGNGGVHGDATGRSPRAGPFAPPPPPPPAPVPPIPPPPSESPRAQTSPLSSPTGVDGPVSTNTAYENARSAMRRACHDSLPQTHVPRDGLTEHQKKLGPSAGDFCRPRFCSPFCVAASCAGFIKAMGGSVLNGGGGLEHTDLGDVTKIKKALKKMAIRNHPDRHGVQRVGEANAATATVLTQQVSFLQGMLADFEYLSVRVVVDCVDGHTAWGSNASSSKSNKTETRETVVLPRVHLGATLAQLAESLAEERPELSSVRGKLKCAFTKTPGGVETALALTGTATLQELGCTKDSLFRMWVATESEKSWEAGFL